MNNPVTKYEERFIKSLLVNLINEDKKQTKNKNKIKGSYLDNGLKACKKLNKQLARPTFDR